ncbi:DUF7553 family protein [Natronorubrum sulfidifaciens]|uniref:Uncharacterized protein n=1 Tax=Natronorubrum sulfidifaciens JCM 14089 TaxID=1230460 RepID=L9WFI6_9EURY|nr:hypothetical protein [Natronorubrum sulfidifaciens]ELY48127.1 hypothetical protein C495_01595 [Natronorubrum sulfidifaciens JCM 14089]
MNNHFHDSLYYLTRAAEHAKQGLLETLEPYTAAVRRRLGREPAPEPTRFDTVRTGVSSGERRVRGAVGRTRATLSRARSSERVDDR